MSKRKNPEDLKQAGRPPLYSNPEEMQIKIDEYFKDCPDKKQVFTKNGIFEMPCPTLTGLALYLGFCDRRSMYEYENKPEFTHTIKKARSRMEIVYEQLLQYGNSGAIFALKNLGWKDKQEIEQTGTIVWHEVKNYGPDK